MATRRPGSSVQIAAIAGHDRTTSKQRSKLTQLGCCPLHARLVRADARLFEYGRPTAGLLWQEYDRRELPARADGLAARLPGSACKPRCDQARSSTEGAQYWWHRCQPHLFPLDWLQQILRKDPAQSVLVNLSIFERFVQATPAPLKQRRERQLRKRVGLRLGQQRIHGIEQGVSPSVKTSVDRRSESLAIC